MNFEKKHANGEKNVQVNAFENSIVHVCNIDIGKLSLSDKRLHGYMSVHQERLYKEMMISPEGAMIKK